MNSGELLKPLEILKDCSVCPRECHVNRWESSNGICRSDASFNIASICIHKGEEPVISGPQGICNIFFTNCNLRCIYCQNHQISDTGIHRASFRMELPDIVNAVTEILDLGINMVGFVSPSHFVPQMKIIIEAIKQKGYSPRWVYNTNAYDKAVTLRSLEGLIDVYLPDFKYMDSHLAASLSGAEDYPEVAREALKEMYRQKGPVLHLSADNTAESGIVIRHLVLPGNVGNSLQVLRYIAGEISLKMHISLMSQYYPTARVMDHPFLYRQLYREEYLEVVNEMEKLGLEYGWVQDFESASHYRPDFKLNHPFE
ncbi:MAG: radical SAM protein [Bacteroidetes bacterium]|nr:radical SAM protein [Bacteroidota bacterium]